MRVLCVAEKPSIAKSIAQILSGGQFHTRPSRSQYIKNYDFDYQYTRASFTVTCVAGHLTHFDFTERHRAWHSCDAFELFDAPVVAQVADTNKAIESNLMQEARSANTLMIWTDCDREGEHIGLEIVQVCKKAKPNIFVNRARFSAIIAQQIHYAAQNPVNLDQAQADAVEARTLLDLRIGAAFTRLQTLALKNQVAQLTEGGVISYGPCQFPTLGFVVQRYNQVAAFVSEKFWYIYLGLKSEDSEKETPFTWKRGHLFDEQVAIAFYEHVMEHATARVTKVTNKGTKKWKPLPLTTVELQKAASRLLRMSPKKILDTAEKLYQQGFVSYPRTETDQFDPQFDFMSLIEKQTADPAWGEFARSLQQGGFNTPRKGKNNDKAHPPIHPTAHAANLNGDDKRVYEFITRRFLACCSKDAEGWQTTVEVDYGGEEFFATGLVVLERNYLLVYPYDKWTGNVLPPFEEDQEFRPSLCLLKEGKTSSPSLLTEADLVSLMDKNGIGTDATIAQHIQTIIDRGYVKERMEGNTKYLIPSKLGLGLVDGYNKLGLQKSLSKPQLRRETERSMVQVCERTKTKHDMLAQTVEQYKEMFIIVKREFNKIVASVRGYMDLNDPEDNLPRRGGGGGGGGGGPGGNDDGDGDDGLGPAPNSETGRKKRGRPPKKAKPPTAATDIPPSRRTKPTSSIRRTESVPVRPAFTMSSNNEAGPSRLPAVDCFCGVPAAIKVANSSKQYYNCGSDKQCGFFQWTTDPVSPSGAVPPVVPRKRPTSTVGDNAAAARACACGIAANLLVVRADTANKGRKFWKCSKTESQCQFFEWDDEPPRVPNAPGQSGTGGECFRVSC
ncbi:hypothetical protein M378DRAFT_185976 [Amanita muscaria Koide BX008]|uniref:DNA topoisomerase n=1 Tax=Amanita muscaria (strain Koide BX008) TaxID=946122 RepID=A0A0C2THH2_AMAMK|nr:hypothetical protein M378DRAFT_185976 [Amanita muscaria Koide BX008]